jgi:hypothetical protein
MTASSAPQERMQNYGTKPSKPLFSTKVTLLQVARPRSAIGNCGPAYCRLNPAWQDGSDARQGDGSFPASRSEWRDSK